MAKIKAFKKLGLKDPQVTKFQDNVDVALKAVLSTPTIDGLLIKGVSLISGQDNFIDHKLGREIVGWAVVRQRAQASIWDTQDNNTFKSKSISLRASANVVVDLWVF